jgi:hypothetical protein
MSLRGKKGGGAPPGMGGMGDMTSRLSARA